MDIRSVRMTVRTFFVSVFVKMPAVYRHIMRMIMMKIIMRMNVIVSQLFMSVDMRMFFFYNHPHAANTRNEPPENFQFDISAKSNVNTILERVIIPSASQILLPTASLKNTQAIKLVATFSGAYTR